MAMFANSCFTLFHGIHGVIDSCEVVQKVTCQIIKEFCEDGVSYLELRSTPRAFPNSTKEDYIDAIISGIGTCKEQKLPIIVKLLVSIDRSQGLQTAHEALVLAKKCAAKYPGIIVGMDLSGNPHAGDGSDYVGVLREAKSLGLKLSLHVAEIMGKQDESFKLLSLVPDRIGHGTFIHPSMGGSDELKSIVTKNRIPLDDKGVFDTTMSKEYTHVQRAFQLAEHDMKQLAIQGIEHIFDSGDVKEYLRRNFSTTTQQ